MTAPTYSPPPLMIVLRQVEGPRWCVVRWRWLGNAFDFAGRIATARPYDVARDAAIGAAKAERLPLGIRPVRGSARRFDPRRDMREPAA